MDDKLANYFKSFNEQLTDDLGSTFDYTKLIAYGKKKKANLSPNSDFLDIPWIDELESIVEKIKAIVDEVNPKIDLDATFKGSERDTYEDRFIVFLIDEISSLLTMTNVRLSASRKKLNDYFVDRYIPFGEVERLKNLSLFVGSDKLYLKEQRKFAQAREVIGRLMTTHYYNVIKKNSSFDQDSLSINSVLANEPLYKECYAYYDTVKGLVNAHYDIPVPPRGIDYQNYAFLSLLLAFDKNGFALFGNSPLFNNKDYLLKIKNLKLARNDVIVIISSESEDHIDLLFEDHGDYTQKGKKTSKVSLDLVPSLNENITSKDEAISYFKKKVEYRINQGYDNAFVITTIIDSQSENVVISSPYGSLCDANLSNMIESCLIYVPADIFTYSRYCPICGGHAEGKDNNCCCVTCGSRYTLLTNKDKKEIVWVKRLKNLEGK